MLNKWTGIGRLVRDPEARTTQSGTMVTTFTIAIDRNYTNQQGERETDFISIVTFKGLAETVAKFISKGRLVAVSGRLQIRKYQDKEDKTRYISEIVADEVQFLDRAKDGQAEPQEPELEEVDNDVLPF